MVAVKPPTRAKVRIAGQRSPDREIPATGAAPGAGRRIETPGIVHAGDPPSFIFEGRAVEGLSGESLAAALGAAGILEWRATKAGGRRGQFCGTGLCQKCLREVDGRPAERVCLTPVLAGMDVRRQDYAVDLTPCGRARPWRSDRAGARHPGDRRRSGRARGGGGGGRGRGRDRAGRGGASVLPATGCPTRCGAHRTRSGAGRLSGSLALAAARGARAARPPARAGRGRGAGRDGRGGAGAGDDRGVDGSGRSRPGSGCGTTRGGMGGARPARALPVGALDALCRSACPSSPPAPSTSPWVR